MQPECPGVEGQPEDLHRIWGCSNCNPIVTEGKTRSERIKNLLKEMAELGIIRITYDPYEAISTGIKFYSNPEIWSRTGWESRLANIHKEELSFTKEEREFYASEYDKCFGTAPRSDEK